MATLDLFGVEKWWSCGSAKSSSIAHNSHWFCQSKQNKNHELDNDVLEKKRQFLLLHVVSLGSIWRSYKGIITTDSSSYVYGVEFTPTPTLQRQQEQSRVDLCVALRSECRDTRLESSSVTWTAANTKLSPAQIQPLDKSVAKAVAGCVDNLRSWIFMGDAAFSSVLVWSRP